MSPTRTTWQKNQHVECWHANLTLSVNFFNVNIGRWEPAVEVFRLQLADLKEYDGKHVSQSIIFETPLKINFTEKLVENLYESFCSWRICEEDYRKFEEDSTKSLIMFRE